PFPCNGILSNDEFLGTDNCYLGGRDNSDFYKLPQLNAGHSIKVRVKPPGNANFDVYVYDQSKRVVAAATTPDDSEETLTLRANTTGAYYVEVRRVSNAGNYTFEVEKRQRDVIDGDAPNRREGSRAIGAGQYSNCYLDDLDRDDFYVFQADANRIIEVGLTAPQDARFWAELIDRDGSLIESSTEHIMVQTTYTGNYYLRIWRESGRGVYSFEVKTYPQNDGGSGGDAGSSTSSAVQLSPSTYTYAGGSTLGKEGVTGWMGKGDECDVYRIPLEAGKSLSVSVQAQGIEMNMDVLNFTGTVVSEDNMGSNRYFCGRAENYSGSRDVYIKLSRVGGGGRYSITYSIAAENDAGSGRDAGWVQGEEVTVNAGENYTGYLDFCDTEDLYGVQLGMNDQLTVRLTPNDPNSNFDLYFYDSTAVYRKEGAIPFVSSTKTGTAEDSVTYLALHAGVYYIRVRRISGLGTYTLRLSVTSVPWPKVLHDVKNTSRGTYAGPDSPTLAWTYTISGAYNWDTGVPADFSPVIGADDTIYCPSRDGNLYAVDRYGALKWRVPINVRTTPLIGSDGTIYVAYENSLGAFNPKDGSLKWSFAVGHPYYSSFSPPTMGPDGTVYLPALNAVYALDRYGNRKWGVDYSSYVMYQLYPLAVGQDGTIYCADPLKLRAVYPENGGIKWAYSPPYPEYIRGPPVIGPDGTIYIVLYPCTTTINSPYYTISHLSAQGGTYLQAIRPDGTLKWSVFVDNYLQRTGYPGLIGIDNDGRIYLAVLCPNRVAFLALNSSNGAKIWELATGDLSITAYSLNAASTAPAIGSENVVYFSAGGYVFAVTKNGTLKWMYLGGATLSSVAVGRNRAIYFSSNDGRLYALETDTTLPFSNVTYPGDGSYLKSVEQITGAAGDYFTGVDSVRMMVRRQSDGAYLTASGWAQTGGDNSWLLTSFSRNDNTWRYTLPQNLLDSGESYTISTMATDNAGNSENPGVKASFTFDNEPPTCSITINDGNGSTRSTQVVLYLSYFDQASPVVGARYSNDGVNWSGWETPARTRSWEINPGTGTVYYQVVDMAGNISEAARDTITYVSDSPPTPEPENFERTFDIRPEFRWSFESPLREDAFLLEIERTDGSARASIVTKRRAVSCTLPGLQDLLSGGSLDEGGAVLASYRWKVSLIAPFVGIVKTSGWRTFRLMRENVENAGLMKLFVGATEDNQLQIGALLRNGDKPIRGGLGGIVAVPTKLRALIEETMEVRDIKSIVMVKVGSVAPRETISVSTTWTPPRDGSYKITCETVSTGAPNVPQRTEAESALKTLPDLTVSEGDVEYNETLGLLVVRVLNAGTVSAGGFNVVVTAGESTTTRRVDGVSAGNVAKVSIPMTLPRGMNLVTISVDPEGAVEESDEGNNEAVAKIESRVGAPPEAMFTYSPGYPNTDTTVVFTDRSTDSDGTIVAWHWEFGDGTTSSLQNPTHRYSSAGTYTVTLRVTDDGGLSSFYSLRITVSAPPPPPEEEEGEPEGPW
ncbi:MAG: PKD domain-containing protein, partial [Candidatus Hadarchaeales archaeon]